MAMTLDDSRRERWLLSVLAGIQFTHLLDFMIMMPLGPEFTRIFSISDAQFGLLVSAYTLSAGASGLLASTYVDRFDRKRLLLVLYAAFGLATLMCGLATGYASLMGARIAAGVFGGVLAAMIQTIVADAVPFERRGRAMGVIMGAFSASTVAGVPLSLYLANHFAWRAPFLVLAALSALLLVVGVRVLPPLAAHLQQSARLSSWARIAQVLRDGNHWRAFVFTALMMASGFTVIPFITIYITSNAGVAMTEVPLIYLCGGVATLFTARLFGALSDRLGKVPTYRHVALVSTLPLVAITLLPPLPLWGVLVVTTAFFVFVSGRMVPGMAIITSAARSELRGTFMTLNAAVQQAAMGIAAFVGGAIIGRSPAGQVVHYGWVGLIALIATLVAVSMVGGISMEVARPRPPTDAEPTDAKPTDAKPTQAKVT